MNCKVLFSTIVAFSLGVGAASAEDAVLNLYNWSGYTPPELLQKFEKETNIKVTLDTYDSNETLLAKLKAGGGGYDLIVSANSFLPIFVEEGLLQPLGLAKMENSHFVDHSKFVDVPWNPNGDYGVPWQWGTNSMVVDTAVYNKPVDSYSVIFSPPPELQGKTGMLKSQTDVMTTVEMYLGIPFCTESTDDAKKILATLKAQKPFMKAYGSASELTDQLLAGDIGAAPMYSGRALRLRGQKSSIKYIFPKEGVLGWVDLAAMPKGAVHPENARKFLNFIMKPENAALLSNGLGYANGVPDATPFLKPELRNAPEMTVPAGIPIIPIKTCSPAATALESQIMTELME